MPPFKDLTGSLFGRLTVVRRAENDPSNKVCWECLCDCGNITAVRGDSLVGKRTASCGCLHKERVAQATTTHGRCGSPEYIIWGGMIQRCTNPNSEYYADYGGRGITVCEDWLKFENFYRDMGDRPSKDHSIDRSDNNGNYCKDNCRWRTNKEQQNNRGNNRLLEFNGTTKTVAGWSESVGIKYDTLYSRLRLGWSIEEALTTLPGAVRAMSLHQGEPLHGSN